MKKIIGITLVIGIVIVVGIAAIFIWNKKGDVPSEVDVVVVGGEPEGVAAAISAARNGASVILIEHRDELGGLFTYGMLNFLDIPQGPDGQSVSRGIFEEWHTQVGKQSAFDVELAKKVFRQMVEAEKNITLLTETDVLTVQKEGSKVVGLTYKNADGEFDVKATSFIDATQDADFAVMAGAPYFVGGEDIGIEDKKMSVTLIIHLNDVDWDGVRAEAASGKFGEGHVSETAAWGFGELVRMYKPVEENTRLRGLNLAKVGNDYYINALQIFGVNGLDEASKAEGIERGKREIDHIVTYLKEEFKGFENAVIASYPPELYVRETRHILAEYQLPMSDVWTNRNHWDNIAYAPYPVDIQAQTPQDYGNVVSAPTAYAIPFRSNVPKEIDGLLVVGRSAGFSSIAAGSARIVPTGMSVAEAAAAQLKGTEKSFRQLSQDRAGIETLRATLLAQGAYLEDIKTTYPYAGEWYDEAVQQLLNYGLIFGRYDNNLLVDNSSTVQYFTNLIAETLYRTNRSTYDENEAFILAMKEEAVDRVKEELTPETALQVLMGMLNVSAEELLAHADFKEAWSYVEEEQQIKLKHVYSIAHALMTIE